MRLSETIKETADHKYGMWSPMISDSRVNYVDYKNPYSLSSGDVYIDRYNNKVLSHNSANFLQHVDVVEFKEFMELAKNKCEIDFDMIYEKQHRISIIGYGGFMSNMFYFIEQIAKEQKHHNYFIKNISVYENDEFSAMNNVRTFKDTSKLFVLRNNSKLNLVQHENIANRGSVNEVYFERGHIDNTSLIIGSPDFDTRQMLENENFIFFGNSNSDFVIHRSPVIDPSMTRETYGQINIVEFWVGILEATFTFLKLLEKYSSKELREMEHNIELWSTNVQKKDSTKIHPLLVDDEPVDTGSRRVYKDEWSVF